MFSHEYNLPVFISSGAVLTSGSTADLTAGQVGIFDAKTLEAVSGSVAQNQAMLVAGGSWHTKSKLNKFVGNLQSSEKSIDFLGKDILEFERSRPIGAKSEQWAIGWDGVSDESLSFEAGKDYMFKVRVWGEDVYGTFLRPIDRFIRVRTKCSTQTDCSEGCSDAVACKTYAKELAKAINDDPELQYFVRAEVISSDYSAPTYTHNLATLVVPDMGDQAALGEVQNAYPDLKVSRIARSGIYSTYQVCIEEETPGTPVTPDDFTPTSAISLAACDGTCPAGYTQVGASDIYTIVRPLSEDTDLSDTAAYADALADEYITAVTFNGATAVEVVAASDQITLTGHPFVTGEKVNYEDGGGTQVVGLTDTSDYYVIKVNANTIKLASSYSNALAGTAIAISDGVGAAHTLTSVVTATYLSQNGSTAQVQIRVAKGRALTAVNADTVVLTSSLPAQCTPPSADAIAWVEGDERYKITRTLKLTLEKECGTATRLADLIAFYANDPEVAVAPTLSTAGTCNDIYSITQYSADCSVDACLSEAEVKFNDLQSFEGFTWTPDVDEDSDTDVKCGVRITAAYEDTKFGGCSFNPEDYYSVRPLKLEVTEFDDSGLPCRTPVPARKLRNNSMATQTGEWVIRQFINANKYRAFGEFYLDPRLREALDANIHEAVDRNKSYVLYFLKVRQNRLWQNHNADYSPEIFEMMFAFPEGADTSAFETAISKVTSQFGIYLQDR